MTREFTRRQLYDLVWSHPMSKVAADLGISDVGLAKTYRKHRVPTPGRGYWARLVAGADLVVSRIPDARNNLS